MVHEEIDGIPVTRVWLYASMGRGARRLASYLSFCISAVFGLWKRGRPDYVFVESPPLFLVATGALFARWRRVKLIVNVSDLWPDAAVDLGVLTPGRMLRVAKRLESWSYRQATVISAVTDGIRDAIAVERAPVEKVRFLPNGVDTELFRPDGGDRATAAQLGLGGEHAFDLVFTGNMGYAQGLDNVVRAAVLAHASDDRIRLTFIGDGSERAELEALVQQLGAVNVAFVDPVPLRSIASVLPYAGAVVVSLRALPTNEGARPSKIFPAMAAGRAILYAGTGEGAQLVADAGAGVVVPNAEVEALAEAMVGLARDRVLREQLGAAGRRTAVERFGWSSLVESWVASLP
jgi:glycosyltransferase involved in cell wall biosynthesis